MPGVEAEDKFSYLELSTRQGWNFESETCKRGGFSQTSHIEGNLFKNPTTAYGQGINLMWQSNSIAEVHYNGILF